MNRPTATHAIAVLVLLLVTGCPRPGANMVAPGGREQTGEQPQVEVVEVWHSDFQEVAEVPASVEPYEKARLMSKLDGYVSEVLVDIGDHVRQGQPLARLSAPELLADVDRKKAMVDQATQDAANYKSQIELAAAVVKQEQETLNLRNTEYDNIKTLVDRGSLNRQKQDEAEFAKNSTQAAVDRATAEVAANEAAHAAALAHISVAESEQTMAEKMVDYLTITAPFDGLITARNVDPGAFVEPATSGNGTPLLEIMQVDQLRVVLYVPMTAIGANKDEQGNETKFVMRVDASDTCYEEKVTVIMEQGDYAAIAADEVSTNDRVVVNELDRVKHEERLAGRIKTVSRDDSE
jgi:multidrug efflux pump subunit AcrA (membrane-fusion protein)